MIRWWRNLNAGTTCRSEIKLQVIAMVKKCSVVVKKKAGKPDKNLTFSLLVWIMTFHFYAFTSYERLCKAKSPEKLYHRVMNVSKEKRKVLFLSCTTKNPSWDEQARGILMHLSSKKAEVKILSRKRDERDERVKRQEFRNKKFS